MRTPPVDVQVAVQSGEAAPGSQALCVLYGSSRAFTPAMLKTLYGSQEQYLSEFADATRQAVAAGYVLAADQGALQQEARQVTFVS